MGVGDQSNGIDGSNEMVKLRDNICICFDRMWACGRCSYSILANAPQSLMRRWAPHPVPCQHPSVLKLILIGWLLPTNEATMSKDVKNILRSPLATEAEGAPEVSSGPLSA